MKNLFTKNLFTKKEILANCGCYSQKKANQVLTFVEEPVTIQAIMDLNIPLKDKRWFVWNACQLSLDQKKELALKLAWIVLPIYEEKYPNDSRVKDCLQATEDFNNNLITKKGLREKRDAAAYAADAADAAAAAAADAAADAAYAADAAAYAAAAYAADAAAAADVYADVAYAGDAAAYAAYVAYASNKTYSQKIQELLIEYLTT